MTQKIKITIEIPRALCPRCEKERIKELRLLIKKHIQNKIKEWQEQLDKLNFERGDEL